MEKSSIGSGDSNSGINRQYGEGSFRKCVDDCVGRVVAPVVMNSNDYRIDHPLVRAQPVVGGHLLADHVHMMISIPPKYAVSQVVGFM